MNIEEPIERLKFHSKYAGLCLNGGTTCIVNISDLDWLLTAYEKEKEKAEYENELRIKYQKRYDSVKEKLEKEKETSHYNQSQLDIANAKLIEEKEKNKKVLDFINDKNNYFEDGENWQNILKIKEILEE